MAKNAVTDWSTTAANNTDIGGINIQGTAPISNGDDAIRELMEQIAAFITAATFTGATPITLVSTDAGASAGPILTLYRNSATPAVSDILGKLLFQGEDSAGNIQDYAEIDARLDDATSGSEDAVLRLRTVMAGSLSARLVLGSTAAFACPVDLTNAGGNAIKFGNNTNSSDTATIDGYTDWVAYTPTISGFGTVSGVSFFSKRVGDNLHIRGKFTAGTVAASEARVTLGFNGTDSNVNSDATKVASIQLAGSVIRSSVGASAIYALIESNVGYLTIGAQNAGRAALTKVNGDAAGGIGDTFSIVAEVPISGW